MSYQKTTPAIVEAVHRLRRDGKSIRHIATELATTKAVIEQALKRDPPSSQRTSPSTPKAPRLEIYRVIRQPAPCPPSSPASVQRAYEACCTAGLFGEADCIAIACGLDLSPIRGALNALDADAALMRLTNALLPEESFDLDAAIVRLTVAFTAQDDERRQVRERLRVSE
jgi:hypothetical protein